MIMMKLIRKNNKLKEMDKNMDVMLDRITKSLLLISIFSILIVLVMEV